jgi:hypothetical protein
VSVSTPGSNLAEAKTMLAAMVAEAHELNAVAGGSVTDAVADWLAPQYLLAAQGKLEATAGTGHYEVLQTFVQDWAMLRHGDHTAERLHIERQRLKLAERDAEHRWRTKIRAGLDALLEELQNNPKAKAAYEAMDEALRVEEEPEKEKEFREWLKKPEIRKEVFSELTRGLSPETLRKIEEELHPL